MLNLRSYAVFAFLIATAGWQIPAALGARDFGRFETSDDLVDPIQRARAADLTLDEHFVDVGDGVILHVVEYRPAGRPQPGRARAVLMLTGTLVTNAQWTSDGGDGLEYNALAIAAAAGFNAFAATYEGYGLSTHPADGRTVTAERLLWQAGALVEWIRHRRHVARVDLVGASLGSSLAIALGGLDSPIPRRHIGKIVLTSLVHRSASLLMQQILFSPETRMALESAPNGYVPTVPPMYGIILSHAELAAAAWAYETFPGIYATGPTLEGFDLPIFDAARGRAPALQLLGDGDLVTPREDADAFQAEYGGPVDLVVLPGGHALNFEASKVTFWQHALDFLDAPRRIAGDHERCAADSR
ncbi:MAG: hypothetical protein AAB426_03535 [Myxococcota bacterium]